MQIDVHRSSVSQPSCCVNAARYMSHDHVKVFINIATRLFQNYNITTCVEYIEYIKLCTTGSYPLTYVKVTFYFLLRASVFADPHNMFCRLCAPVMIVCGVNKIPRITLRDEAGARADALRMETEYAVSVLWSYIVSRALSCQPQMFRVWIFAVALSGASIIVIRPADGFQSVPSRVDLSSRPPYSLIQDTCQRFSRCLH